LGTRRANCIGWHFFACFFVATDKKVSRHQAKKQNNRNNKVRFLPNSMTLKNGYKKGWKNQPLNKNTKEQ